MNYTQSDREIAIQLILAEVGKGYTIDEAVRRLTSNQHHERKGGVEG